MTGLRFFISMRIPGRVFIRLIPSAPPASQALAIPAMSVTFGDSFMMTGFFVTFLTAAVTFSADAGSTPKLIPPPWTFGQDMFTSNHPICFCGSSRETVYT